ncbi:MAG: PEP-CTERM system histidine kinase PrsK [Syntrophaceae bacterium]|nr:PEP-CTERM system histidine kinase PrsK [Syntrophaceae bacterium]
MEILEIIKYLAAIAGIVITILILFSPRFGRGSWMLCLFLLPASLSSVSMALQVGEDAHIRITLSLFLIAATGAVLACHGIDSDDYLTNIKSKKRWLFPLVSAGPLVSVGLYFIPSEVPDVLTLEPGLIFLGPIGYVSAMALLILSVTVLAQLEQILRNAEEKVRWEIKFLLLGIGISFATVIYISSKILLLPPRFTLISENALSLFPIFFLTSSILTFVSWKRSSGRSQVVVSQGLVYSSVTLLAVGVYLIASSLIARWISQWGEIGLPVEAFIFLLSAIILSIIMLGTAFRHRARYWIRRNIFAGRYDYRRFWLEATERIRSIDPPSDIASALANIVHKALGAIDVSVWIRKWNPNRMDLLYSLGTMADSTPDEISGIVEKIIDISEPLSQDKLDSMQEMESVKEFMKNTNASLLVPLTSSNRIVGILTVGSDRSGRPYDVEAREFLRALAGHAASEFHKSDLLATLVAAKEDEAFRTFSTFLLHDLKNFASTLSLIAKNAPRYQDNPDFQKDAFQSVFDTAEKMKRLCNSLGSFSSTLAANKKITDLDQIVREVADNLNAGLSNRLVFELGKVAPVLVDREELSRVLHNLLTNAREAISTEGSVTIRTVQKENTVVLSVMDNGRGMGRDFMTKELFLPFHTTKSDGLGIGLFQSKKIMEAHKGSIHIESEEGKGTTVELIFPVVK